MPKHNLPNAADAVSQFVARRQRGAPIPLIATRYDIALSGGLAEIMAKRTFRNDESNSIEAVLTFPLPVHAVVHGLEAKIGDRVLNAKATARVAARERYEDAIDTGKSAVLHEELMRGVHLLSVGHVPPGCEIEVTMRAALAVSCQGDAMVVRLPLTVGQVYGRSGLPDSDELVADGPEASGEVCVTSDNGNAVLRDGSLREGRATVPLNRPLVIAFEGWQPRDLVARAADGRAVTLSIKRAKPGILPLDAAVLVDRSGSMDGWCSSTRGATKHAAVVEGLHSAAGDVSGDDQLSLWQFDDNCESLGVAGAHDWPALLPKLDAPRGGTQIGKAIQTVLATSESRDVVIITDGQSFDIDVPKLARSGRRFTVVLIGEASLEARVGYLAALTGGEIFVGDDDVAGAVKSALLSIREAPGNLSEGELRRHGMVVSANWRPAAKAATPPGEGSSRAVAAYGASLLLPALDEASATALAVAEGLVTHLTSLVLVDDAGASQEGLPVMRKVALPMLAARMLSPSEMFGSGVAGSNSTKRYLRSFSDRGDAPAPRQRTKQRARPSASTAFSSLGRHIDWGQHAEDLGAGNPAHLDPLVVVVIKSVAGSPEVQKAAAALGIDPLALVLGLLALSVAAENRHARRVAERLLGKRPKTDFTTLQSILGLATAS